MSYWISVKDGLPDKEEIILIFNNKVMIGIYSDDCYGDKFFTSNFEQFLPANNITHWMPLPKPPKE